ncbi:MAG TPA: ThuA domain-containing protein, partial [Chthoniobacteraceae bacterium]
MKRLLFAALVLFTVSAVFADDTKPIKVLLVAGGCCHDYSKQKDILKEGLEKRANLKIDIVYSPDTTTKPNFPIYGNPDYAKGYDVVIHDECAADINTQSIVEGVLKPHQDGIPGVNLHCAMHCYRIGNPNEKAIPGTPHALWFEYLGLQSSGHDKQLPIAITFTDKNSPITKGLTDWTTIGEELYNNVQILTGQALAHGVQMRPAKQKQADGTEIDIEKPFDYVVAWTNMYQGKTRVFSTTIGHNDKTVAD